MKKILIVLFVLVIIGGVVGYFWYVRGRWIQPQLEAPAEIEVGLGTKLYHWELRAEMPTPRTEVTAAALGGKIYVIGGFDGVGRTVGTVEIYDPVTDTWTTGPELPEGRHHASAVAVGDALFVLGGFTGLGFDPTDTVFEIDLQSQSWKVKNPMPIKRGAAAAAVIDAFVYLVGGVTPEGLSNELWQYNVNHDEWTSLPDAPTQRDHLAAAAILGKLYVSGGREQSLSANLAVLDIYDPSRKLWSQGPDMPTARGGVAGANFDGLFVVAGGEQPSGTFEQVEGFDPVSETWVSLPRLPTARHGLAAVAVGDRLYVIGGGKNPGLSVSGSNEVLVASQPE